MRKAAVIVTITTLSLVACAGLRATPMERMEGVAEAAIQDDTTGGVVYAILDGDGNGIGASAGVQPDGSPVPLDGLFRIASVTKSFVATAVLQLVEEGLIDLDAPIVDYIDVPENHSGPIVRQLLNHTSGVPDPVRGPDEAHWVRVRGQPDRPVTQEELLAFFADLPLDFHPGTDWGYSNGNYVYLGLIIEAVTGQPAHEVVRDRILDPLGLESTYFSDFEDGPEVVHAEVWIPDEGLRYPYPYTANATAAWTAGAMVSTASDLGVFYDALFDGDLLGESLLADMTTIVPGSETGDPVSGYGFGLVRYSPKEFPGVVFYGHGGGMPGFQSLVWHHPPTSETIVMLSTDPRIDFYSAAMEMTELVAASEDEGWQRPPVSPTLP